MNFFLDENVPLAIEQFLRSLGFNTFSTRKTENEGVNDEVAFKIAQQQNAIFISTNKDFFHTIPFLFQSHCGVIVINLRKPNRYNLTEIFIKFFENFDFTNFKNTVVLLKENTFTIKKH